MRTPFAKAKPPQSPRSVINATKKLWRQYHLTYDQTHHVAKEVRHALTVEHAKTRKRVVARLSREEETRLIAHAYRMKGERVATTLLERGIPIEQRQKFLGHAKLATTQLSAESSTEMRRESSQRALGR